MANDFNLDQVADNQNDKEDTINSAFDQLASAMGNQLTLDATAGNIVLTQDQGTRSVYFKRTDTTAARSITVRQAARFFLYENSAVSTNLVRGATTVAIASSEKVLMYSDGTANGLTKVMSSTGATVSDIPGLFSLSGDISPTQLVAATNDWAPTGLAGAAIIRVSTDTARNLTGLTGGADGRIILLISIDNGLVLKNADAASSASNRFLLGGADVTLAANQGVFLWYDSTSSRWRMIGASSGGGGGVTTFVALTDAFTFSGNGRKFAQVNSGETALAAFEIPYAISVFVPGIMTNAQLVYTFIAIEDIKLVSGATGSQAKSGIASTGNVHFDVKKNGSDLGDVVFNVSTAGTFTVGSDIDLAAGDLFQVYGPATADATLADVSITFKFKRVN